MNIPSEGEKHQRDLVTQTHPDYEARATRFRFFRDSLEGIGGYEDYFGLYFTETGKSVQLRPEYTYLQRYTRESAAAWKRRREGAYYPNYIAWVVGVALGLLTRESPKRDGYPKPVDKWISAVNWDKRRARLFKWCLGYGEFYVQVDMPNRGTPAPASAAGVPKSEPYYKIIHPDRVLDWATNADGDFDWLKYESDISEKPDPLTARRTGRRIWVLAREGWWYYDLWDDEDKETPDKEIPVAKSGVWEGAIKGRVPVVCYRSGIADDDGINRAFIEQPARIMRRLYNVLSQKAATQDRSCFPIYQYPVKTKDEIKKLRVGDATAVPYWFDSTHAPGYADYDVKPVEHMAEEARALVTQLKEVVSLAFDEDAASTGIAKSYAFLQLNVTLASQVAQLERFELEVSDLVARWKGDSKGMPEDAKPGYPTRFDVVDAKADIELGTKLLDFGGYGPKARREIKRQMLLGRFLQDLPNNVKKELETELKEEGETTDGMDDQPEPVPEEASKDPDLQLPRPPDKALQPR